MGRQEEEHRLGPAGWCVCPRCETRVPHRRGIRCHDERCPSCGAGMLREGSAHHQSWLEKRGRKDEHTMGDVAPREDPPGR